MRIIYGLKKCRIKEPTAVAIGIFDGIHLGHKKVLREVKKAARRIKGKSCVVTFDPHPAKVLHPHRKPPMLVSTAHKLFLLGQEGIDITVVVRFDSRFSRLSPAEFVQLLADRLNAREILVGSDFLFGQKRSGDVNTLRREGSRLGILVRSVPHVKSGGSIISSTLVRTLVMAGRLEAAEKLLGRKVTVLGTVKKGTTVGRLLGFPTANLDLHHEAIPPSGVYIVKIKLGSILYNGVANISEGKDGLVEVHIFGFRKNIYGKDLEVMFLKRIRAEAVFKDRQKLRDRIKKDAAVALRYFKHG